MSIKVKIKSSKAAERRYLKASHHFKIAIDMQKDIVGILNRANLSNTQRMIIFAELIRGLRMQHQKCARIELK